MFGRWPRFPNCDSDTIGKPQVGLLNDKDHALMREKITSDNDTLLWVAQVMTKSDPSTLYLLLRMGQQMKVQVPPPGSRKAPNVRIRFDYSYPGDARILLETFEHYGYFAGPAEILSRFQGWRDAGVYLSDALHKEFDRRLRVALQILIKSRNTAAERIEMFTQSVPNLMAGPSELRNTAGRLRNWVKRMDAVVGKLQKGLFVEPGRGATFEQLAMMYQYLKTHASQFADVNMPYIEDDGRYVAELINIAEKRSLA